MQYLFHKPFKETDSIAFKISKDISETGKMDFYIKPDERVIGKLFSKQTKDPYLLRENPLRFSGKSFLLIGNGTFSAAVMFASSFKCFGDGTIIGEETGGITVGSGDAHFFYLPNSKMKIMVSWKKFYEVCGIDNRRGVLPDYLVSNTVEDEIQKKDKVLEFTIDFISRR
jgi:C-terminal processing protease CtpA/Prc